MTARTLFHFSLYTLLVIFSLLMLDITLQYLPIDLDVAFLRIKQEAVALPYYRIAFFIHVFTSMFALAAGFTQFSRRFRSGNAVIHRNIGKLYFYVVVFLSGPTGLIMAYHANGGLYSQIGFSLLAILWITTTAIAVYYISKGNVVEHRRWMIRSYALTLSAITLRLWKWGIVLAFEPKPMDVYRIVAWLGWVLNVLVAEIIIGRRHTHR